MHPSKTQALLNIEAELLKLSGAGKTKSRDLEGYTYWDAHVDGEHMDIECLTLEACRAYVEETIYDRHREDYYDGRDSYEAAVEYVKYRLDADWEPREQRRVKEEVWVDLTPCRSDFAEHNTLNRSQQGV